MRQKLTSGGLKVVSQAEIKSRLCPFCWVTCDRSSGEVTKSVALITRGCYVKGWLFSFQIRNSLSCRETCTFLFLSHPFLPAWKERVEPLACSKRHFQYLCLATTVKPSSGSPLLFHHRFSRLKRVVESWAFSLAKLGTTLLWGVLFLSPSLFSCTVREMMVPSSRLWYLPRLFPLCILPCSMFLCGPSSRPTKLLIFLN